MIGIIGQKIVEIRDLARRHFYVFLLLFLALLFFHSIISSAKIMSNIHYINDVTFYSYNMKESLKNHDLPLWTPYFYSGRPLFAQPEYHFIDLNFLLILLTGNIYLAMNFSAIAYLFIAGLGMYLLVISLIESRKAAFIAALVYMFNAFVHTFVVPGNIMIIEGYSLAPFIFLFAIRALKKSGFIFNSVIAGVFIALLVFSGGVVFLPFIFLLIASYSVIYLIGSNVLNKLLKLLIVGILISAAAFGLSAVKLLPGAEFVKLSNRGQGLPYQEFIGDPIELKDFVFTFVTNQFSQGSNISASIGIMGFILLIVGLHKFKDKIVLSSAAAIILSLIISHESAITKVLYEIPVFNQLRHIERSIFLFVFAGSILAGYGFLKLNFFIEKYKKLNKNILFSIVVVLVLSELVFSRGFPESQAVIKPNDIPILDYMGNDKSQFRTINLAMSTLIGASGYNYYSQLGISELKGGGGIWFNDYLEYLIVAQNSPAKFWGILNSKYVVANSNLSIEGLKYIGKFKDCKNCAVWEAFGPYLYENTAYLPKYYIVSSSVLVVGDDETAKQIIYRLMLNGFDPKSSVLVQVSAIDGYDASFLKKFDYIILGSGSIGQNSLAKLRDYVNSGGIIAPDILNGKDTITNEDVSNIFNKTTGVYKEVNIEEYLNNKITLNLNGEKGWLVASERFAYFPGWKASIDGKGIEIFKADNAVTALFLDGYKGRLIFEYAPSSYKTGKLVSVLALIIIIIYFGYFIYKKRKSGGENQA